MISTEYYCKTCKKVVIDFKNGKCSVCKNPVESYKVNRPYRHLLPEIVAEIKSECAHIKEKPMTRTIAKEYVKLKKTWDEIRPKVPSINMGDEEDLVEMAKVTDSGNALIQGYNDDGDLVTIELSPEKAYRLGEWLRETFVDLTTAMGGPRS